MAEKKTKLVEIKTKPTEINVEDFINSIKEEQKRKDSFVLLEMMKKISGDNPVLWSNSIIGFGKIRFKSPATGREVEWMKMGFAPRKANFSLYLAVHVNEYAKDLEKLGKFKTGVGCLYINKLADVDLKVLERIMTESLKLKNL
ncbi:MAG TPA: DUF1801 domain-containing protein [Lentimicrobium sp.]|nr:DUF1801 domain-containing protein [Lentimicrobium sp.]